MIVLHLIHVGYIWSLVMLNLFCLMAKRRTHSQPPILQLGIEVSRAATPSAP